MKAVILAAGRGTRLEDLTHDTPKCLIRVNHKPLLEYQLEALLACDITEITVVLGHCKEQVINYLDGRFQYVINEKYAETNSIYSLWLAHRHLVGSDFLLINGDVLFQKDYISKLVSSPKPTACLIDNLKTYNSNEYQAKAKYGRIIEYSKNIPAYESIGESAQCIKIGARDSYIYFSHIKKCIDQGQLDLFPSYSYKVLIEHSHVYPVFTNGAAWYEIDDLSDLQYCNDSLASESLV